MLWFRLYQIPLQQELANGINLFVPCLFLWNFGLGSENRGSPVVLKRHLGNVWGLFSLNCSHTGRVTWSAVIPFSHLHKEHGTHFCGWIGSKGLTDELSMPEIEGQRSCTRLITPSVILLLLLSTEEALSSSSLCIEQSGCHHHYHEHRIPTIFFFFYSKDLMSAYLYAINASLNSLLIIIFCFFYCWCFALFF